MATGTASAHGDRRPNAPRDDTGWRRVIPRTALGLAGLLFFMGIASAFTGAVLYAYYDYRLGKTEDRNEEFQASFKDEIDKAKQEIQDERSTAVEEINSQLDELQKFAPSGDTLSELFRKTRTSVWFVSTLDEHGQPSVGSAFVVFADAEQSFLLTSFNTVRAATRQPAPEVIVRKRGEELRATVNGWDPANDLALLVIDRANLPSLPWAKGSPVSVIGDRIFALSGLGADGGAITHGFVADVSANGIQHSADIGAHFQGGPLLNSDGEVVAVSSRAYSPLGFSPEAVFFGVPIRTACTQVIRCPEGTGGG
jgi:S1-C subfamily serine protease